MPGGTLAGPYNSTTWVDPNDPTILGTNALGADLVDSPVTISFWIKFNQADLPFDETAPSLFSFGRWAYEPWHNSGNNKGITAGCSKYAAGYNTAPVLNMSYGVFRFSYVLAGVSGSYSDPNRWETWKARANPPFDDWVHFLAYFSPGEAANDTSKFNMYFNNDDTRGTASGATPTTAGVYPNYTDSTVIANSFSNPWYGYPGNRTILGSSSDTNGGNSDANKGYEIKELVLYTKVVSESERNTIYNSGTPLGSKDLYPTGALAGYFFDGSTTYEADYWNGQQGEMGRWKSKNVFGSPKGDVTSNYSRHTTAGYEVMGNYPSPLLLQTGVGHSN
tara:strand:+ start:6125 stop:7126 length:1002 start_codon:yes stop_codon:yes gene_type:complete